MSLLLCFQTGPVDADKYKESKLSTVKLSRQLTLKLLCQPRAPLTGIAWSKLAPINRHYPLLTGHHLIT